MFRGTSQAGTGAALGDIMIAFNQITAPTDTTPFYLIELGAQTLTVPGLTPISFNKIWNVWVRKITGTDGVGCSFIP
jgi:hypothetical protein